MKLFESIENYSQMLVRIASMIFILNLFLTYLIFTRTSIGEFSLISELNMLKIPFLGINLPIANFLVSGFLSLLSRYFKLHDILSDVLHIRKNFDAKYIISYTYRSLGINENQRKIKENRKRIMSNIFYEYASSSEGENKISKHLITKSLDQWTIFWMLLEADFYILITSIILIYYGEISLVTALLITLLFFALLMKVSYKKSIENAYAQVEAIIKNKKNKKTIKEYLNAI